ncbi:hypothetical protein LCGC14_1555070 [marine sediment metagenome]|uniref:HTH cro/C1-type domain-containing protein n=1 Tax=marine sediment metagenome TaxID=412755 RepID=A0A0F9JA61_9ZZZZ
MGKTRKTARVADTARAEVRKLREKRGLSQRQAAVILGVRQARLCELESGARPMTLRSIQLVADGYGVPVRVIFGR